MRFKLTPGSMLLAALCICLMGEDLWLKNALASYTGRIVFSSLRDGNYEIYVMDANGKHLKLLSNHAASDPDWFDPATLAVAPAGKSFTIWGRLKRLVSSLP